MKFVDIKYQSHYIHAARQQNKSWTGSDRQHFLLGNRSMVGQRTLTPSIKVRILVPQPNRIKHLDSNLKFLLICPVRKYHYIATFGKYCHQRLFLFCSRCFERSPAPSDAFDSLPTKKADVFTPCQTIKNPPERV